MSIKVAEAHSKNLVGNISSAVPFGYKQTEVGIIPEDWDCKAIGDLGDVVRGGSPRPAGDPRYFDGDFIPWLTVASLTNISKSILYVTETASCLTESGSKQSRILQPNTLIISNSGATLGVAKMLGIKCCANDGIAAIINQKFGHKPFLVHFINTKTQELHDTIATGNGQPNLNTALIRNIHVPFPSIEEQTAIANALSDVDALIQELEKLIAKKQAIKTATMQQLLTGRTRLPQFAHHPDGRKKSYKPSELGEIPEDWSISVFEKLCKVFTKQTGFDYSAYIKPSLTQVYRSGYIPFIQNKDFCAKSINFDTDYFIPMHIAVNFPNIMLDEKSLLISISGSIGNVGVFENQTPSFIGGAVAIGKFYDPELIDWVMFYMLSEQGQRTLFGNVKSGSHQNLTLDDIRRFHIPFPSKEEQFAITRALSDIQEEIQTLEKRLNKTRQITQGMMQELLTGKTRLVKPAEPA